MAHCGEFPIEEKAQGEIKETVLAAIR